MPGSGTLTGQQLIRDALRFLLDLGGNIGERETMLGAQDLLETGTEQWPTGLREIEVAPEIEQGALAERGRRGVRNRRGDG